MPRTTDTTKKETGGKHPAKKQMTYGRARSIMFNNGGIYMKKLALILISLVLVCTFIGAADVQLHGFLTAKYTFEFMEGQEKTHSYGIEGSVFGFTVELNKLSLSRKGEVKPYVEIAASAALSFKVEGGYFHWGTYGCTIPGTALKGTVTIDKFNIFGDFHDEEYVVDLIHNKIGGDWAKSSLGKYYYTKYNGDPDTEEDIPHEIMFLFPLTAPMTFSNHIAEFARYNPGFTVTWKDWSVGIGVNGSELERHNLELSLGITSPDFKFDDNQGRVKFALETQSAFYLASFVNIGGSVKASWGRDRMKLALESDFGWSFLVSDGEYGADSIDADVHFLAEVGIASLEFYFTTLTPLLGYRVNLSDFFPTETETVELVLMKYYSDARFTLDFHKSQEKEIPVKVYVTGYDMFIPRGDELRTVPYEEVITGDHGRFSPFTGFAEERYGRDLDVDFETDAFASENITSVKIYAHKLLQTVQIGSKLEFKFGKVSMGVDSYYDFGMQKIYGKVFSEYNGDDVRGYAMAMVLIFRESPEIVKPFNFGCVVGLSSDTFVDFATVGAEFRWNVFDFYSSAPSTFRDFTVYCTVDF